MMTLLYVLYAVASLTLGAVAWTSLVWMLDAWRTPRSLEGTRLKAADVEPRHSFSLIVPARHEDRVLEATLTRLVASDHPAFDVVVVVGDDDPETRRVAKRVARRSPGMIKIVTDRNASKNKPKALNSALRRCTGDIVGVFDAEDVVHPALLRRIDQCFQRTGADVVQSGVQLMNFSSSWLAVRSALEYYFWFRSRLHFHARQGFIPLGGNTVFARTELIRQAGGWDPDCLAEDCELGVRLSTLDAHTVVVYEPALVTREESPATLRAFVRQRTRWNQGYLQTLAKGYWRSLPTRRRLLGMYTLAMPYLMALMWLLFPVAIATTLLLKAPIPVTLLTFLPLLPTLSILAVEVTGLGEFARAYEARASLRDYVRLVLGLVPYQMVLAFAALRAGIREALGSRGWEKTAHFGLHFAQVRDAVPAAVGSLHRVAAEHGLSIDAGARALGFRRRRASAAGAIGACVLAGIAIVVLPFFITHLTQNRAAAAGSATGPARVQPPMSLPWLPSHSAPPGPVDGNPGGGTNGSRAQAGPAVPAGSSWAPFWPLSTPGPVLTPTPTLPVPTPSLPLPTPKLPVPTPSLPLPTPSLPLPTPSLPLPTPSLPVPTPSLPVPTPSLPLPTPSLPLPTPSLPLPTPSLPLPTPSLPLPTPSLPVPTPSLPLPTPSLPVPTPSLPLPTPSLPVPTPSLPVPTPSLPVPTPSLPVPTPSLPVPTPSLPVPTPSAPLPAAPKAPLPKPTLAPSTPGLTVPKHHVPAPTPSLPG